VRGRKKDFLPLVSLILTFSRREKEPLDTLAQRVPNTIGRTAVRPSLLFPPKVQQLPLFYKRVKRQGSVGGFALRFTRYV